VLDSAKTRPRHWLGVLALAASAYAVDRWFFSGLTASKWIGLPQFAVAMRELQSESLKWGFAAVIFEVAAFALLLPRWPKRPVVETKSSPLTLNSGTTIYREYSTSCLLYAVLCILCTLVLAILIPVIANFSNAVVHLK
jgi:hypothetical protein